MHTFTPSLPLGRSKHKFPKETYTRDDIEFFDAVIEGDFMRCKEVVKRRRFESTSKRTSDGDTPMHLACANAQHSHYRDGHLKIVEWLADEWSIYKEDAEGRTPLKV